MNKLIVTLAAAALSCAALNAQNYTPKPADYERFGSTRTLVVLDANMFSDWNMHIKTDMGKEWTPTEVAYINRDKFETQRKDPSLSFLLTTTVTYPEDKLKDKYTYLSLLMGKKNSKVTNMPDLISIPLAFASTDEQQYVYKLPAFIRFMLKHVEAMKADPSLISDTPLMRYNKNKKSLANKTLYLIKEELDTDIRTEADIRKVYPYRFKLVTEDEVRKAIEDRNDDVVFLHKVGPNKANKKGRCYKMLMGASDAEVYFFDYHKINVRNPDCLRAKDLKSIADN